MKTAQHQNESLSERFAETLRKARGKRSQAEFARDLGISSQATYQRYESGRIPDGDILFQMATRLGVTMEELLTGGKRQKVSVYKGENGELVPIPWGFELEENTDFTISVSTIAANMSAERLVKTLRELVRNPALSEKSRTFWKNILVPWLKTQIDLEEFEKLPPEERILSRVQRNEELKGHGEKDRLKRLMIALEPFLSKLSADELGVLERTVNHKRRLKQFLDLAQPDGFIHIPSDELLTAVVTGIPVEKLKLRSSGRPELTKEEKNYLLEWERYTKELGERPAPSLRAVGRIPLPTDAECAETPKR